MMIDRQTIFWKSPLVVFTLRCIIFVQFLWNTPQSGYLLEILDQSDSGRVSQN